MPIRPSLATEPAEPGVALDGPRSGRAAARDRARARILSAAQRVFAQHGYAGASIAQIAIEAGVAKGLLHHHFGSKRDLWVAAIDALARDAAEHGIPESAAGDSLAEIEALTSRMFGFFCEHPTWSRLENWARLEGEDPLPESLLSLERRVDAVFEQAQSLGVMRDDVDPLHVRVLIHLATAGWQRTKEFLSPAWGRDPDAPETDEAFLADLLRILRVGLAPIPDSNQTGESQEPERDQFR